MTLTTHKRAVGIFVSHQAAEHALNGLRDHGFAMNQVSIVAKDPGTLDQSNQTRETRVHELSETTHVNEGALTGAAAGSAIGGLTGLLVGLGTLAIPGIGPIMLAGAAATAIASSIAGGAIGTATGGLVGGLVGLGIPEDRARGYHDHVVSGNYLLIVDGNDDDILQAETILKQRGIREWEVYNSLAIGGYVEPPASRV
jgi:hypothetical protein